MGEICLDFLQITTEGGVGGGLVKQVGGGSWGFTMLLSLLLCVLHMLQSNVLVTCENDSHSHPHVTS